MSQITHGPAEVEPNARRSLLRSMTSHWRQQRLSAPSQLLPPAYTLDSVNSGDSLDAAGLANPQSPSTVVEAPLVASLLERLDDFGMHLDVSLARRSENEAAINELEQLLKEQRAVNSAGANSKKRAGPSTF